MERFIVAIETVKIKEFLFSTNKLKVIRGASYLLDYLNQVEVPKIIKKDNRVEEKDIIYVGAGNAKFFVERDTKEEAERIVKEIIKEVKDKYEKEAPGAKVVGVYVETQYEKGKKSGEGKEVWNDLDKLGELTAIEKSKGFSTLNIDLPHVEKCELSGTEVAEVDSKNLVEDLKKLGYQLNETEKEILISQESLETEIDKVSVRTLQEQIEKLAKTTGRISEASLKKIIASNLLKESKIAIEEKVGFYQYIKNYIKEYNKTVSDQRLIIELKTNIDDFENEDSFIGFVYSDGDALGEFFKNLKNTFKNMNSNDREDEYLKFIGNFSKNLDEITKSSLAETLVDIFKNVNNEKRWGEFLIVGGDDVCAVFDPTLSLEISTNFQKKFEDKMYKNIEKMVNNNTKKLLESKITSSSGVVIAKSKTPIFQLFEKGMDLQKSAKKARRKAIDENLNKTGFIDFQVIGSEGCVDIDDFRKTISSEENKVIERPYAINIDKNDKNIKNFEELIKIIRKLKKANFPSNKLRYMYDLKRNSELEEFEKKMDFINILSKMDKNNVELIKEMGIDYDNYDKFNKNFKNIFDILEIYKFINDKDEVKGGNE